MSATTHSLSSSGLTGRIRDGCASTEKPRHTGFPACAGNDTVLETKTLPHTSSWRAQRSNPVCHLERFWIASLRRRARNDDVEAVALCSQASPSRWRRHRAVGIARPVGRGRLRRPDSGVGIAHRLGDGRRLCLAGVVAVARCGGLDGGGGNQGSAENSNGLLHGCFSRDDVPAERDGVVVLADMAMHPPEHHRRGHHVGASKFFGPG